MKKVKKIRNKMKNGTHKGALNVKIKKKKIHLNTI